MEENDLWREPAMEELRSFCGTSERGCKTGKGWDGLGEGVQKGTKTLSVLKAVVRPGQRPQLRSRPR